VGAKKIVEQKNTVLPSFFLGGGGGGTKVL
jgi:hypothetical protein